MSPVRLAVRVFAVFTLIYLCTWAGHYTSGDGSFKIAWAQSMLGQATILAPDASGVYSKYGIGHSLVAVPPLAIAHFVRERTGIRCEAALYTLMFIANGGVFLGLLAYYLAHFFPSRAVWWTVLITGLATIWWPYTKLDFSEPLVLTVAFLGFVLMRFGYPSAGILIAGFALAIRTDAVVIVVPMMLWYLFRNRTVLAGIRVVLGLAPGVGLVLLANYIRYHSWMDQGYVNEPFSNAFLVGLYGMLFSSGKSIFLFSPPLLLGVWGWKRFANGAETASDAWLFLGVFLAQILLYAKWWDWSSDDAWGVRFLIPGILMMCIPMITVIDRRRVVIPIFVVGVAVQTLAVTVGGLDFLLLLRSVHPERQALYVGGSNRIDFEDVRFDPNYSQLEGNWILLRHLLHVPPEPGRPEDVAKAGTRLYDAIPQQAWRAAAAWDFVWTRKRSP